MDPKLLDLSTLDLINKEGECKTLESDSLNYIGLYFSKSDGSSCESFTTQLITYYTERNASDKFEIVFVSSDNTKYLFEKDFGDMPWLALKFDAKKTKDELTDLYRVRGLPALVILKCDGNDHGIFVSADGQKAVARDEPFSKLEK